MTNVLTAFLLVFNILFPIQKPGHVFAAHAGASHTFTRVQEKNSGFGCGNPCTISGLSAIGSSHVVVVGVTYGNASTLSMTAISDGHSTYSLNVGTSSCRSTNNNGSVMGAALNSVSGGTSVTVTLNSNPSSFEFVFVEELAPTPADGLTAIDSANSTPTNSDTSPFPGALPVIAGSNDAIVQIMTSDDNTPTAISGGYGNTDFLAAGGALANLLNTTSTTRPTWTVSTAAEGCASQVSVK